MDLFCSSMPKAELHAHLAGSLSVQTIRELISLRKQSDPNYICPKDGQDLVLADEEKTTLNEAFQLFPLIQDLLRTPQTVTLATERVIQEFYKDNVRYLELRSTPKTSSDSEQNFGMNNKPMSKRDYVEAVLAGIRNCSKVLKNDNDNIGRNSGILVKLILSIDRRQSLRDAWETLDLATSFRKEDPNCEIVGLELSGDPKFDGRTFIPVFEEARKRSFRISLHLFESTALGEEVNSLLNLIPDRIGHATFARTDQSWTENISKNRIPLEICLTSNVLCQTVSSYSDSHLEFWLNKNHPVCICTDDKGLFGTSLSREFLFAAEAFNLSKQNLFDISLDSFKFAFACHGEIMSVCANDLKQFAEINGLKCCL